MGGGNKINKGSLNMESTGQKATGSTKKYLGERNKASYEYESNAGSRMKSQGKLE